MGIDTRLGQGNRCFPIDPGEDSVPIDISEHNCGHARIFELSRKIDRGNGACFCPTFDGDHAISGIDPHNHAAGMSFGRTSHEFGIANRNGSKNDPTDASIQPARNILVRADAATELHMHAARNCVENSGDRISIHRLSRKSAIQINHMKPREAQFRKGVRLVGRALIVHRGLFHLALNEADTLAIFQVDCGEQNHRCLTSYGAQDRKLDNSFNPSFWLFSG